MGSVSCHAERFSSQRLTGSNGGENMRELALARGWRPGRDRGHPVPDGAGLATFKTLGDWELGPAVGANRHGFKRVKWLEALGAAPDRALNRGLLAARAGKALPPREFGRARERA